MYSTRGWQRKMTFSHSVSKPSGDRMKIFSTPCFWNFFLTEKIKKETKLMLKVLWEGALQRQVQEAQIASGPKPTPSFHSSRPKCPPFPCRNRPFKIIVYCHKLSFLIFDRVFDKVSTFPIPCGGIAEAADVHHRLLQRGSPRTHFCSFLFLFSHYHYTL